MSLTAELKALQTRLEAKRPPEILAQMHRAVDELRASGAPVRVLKPGSRMPDFTLPDADGRPVAARTLLAQGPLVVTFYRGRW